jgi:predicted phage baseplate assembly protein
VYAAYRTGGGVAGNVAAQTLTTVPSTAHNLALVPALGTLVTPLGVLQVLAADGGAPRETLSAAQARAFAAVCAVDKAVTLEDFERLALATPGVPVARVSAVSNLDPDLACYPAPGVVTLIVIPPCPRPAPVPSRALLDAVERYLEPRRLVTSEIHAIAPSYRRVGVNATLNLECDADPQKVVASATARINAFFDPLTGGRDQAGWTFGRTVYRTEMMELLANLPGVSRVTALSLQSGCPAGGCAGAGAGPGSTCGCSAANANPGAAGGCCGASPDGGRCDNIELCPHELVVPGSHRLQTVSDVARNLTRSDARECPSS